MKSFSTSQNFKGINHVRNNFICYLGIKKPIQFWYSLRLEIVYPFSVVIALRMDTLFPNGGSTVPILILPYFIEFIYTLLLV